MRTIRSRERSRGFTLLELMIVVIILGILASVAIPQFSKSVRRSRTVEARNAIGMVRGAELRYFQEWGAYTATIGNLDVEDPSQTAGIVANSRFNYAVVVGGGGASLTTITATGVSGTPTAGITVTYTEATGVFVDAGL